MTTTDTLAEPMVAPPSHRPLPLSSADFRRLSKHFRDHTPHLKLDLDHTDTGEPFVSVFKRWHSRWCL
jgi:hypothetical protein